MKLLSYYKSETDFDQAQINDLQNQLKKIEDKTKDMKKLEYYQDQIYFHQTEKRLKSSEKVRLFI